MNEFLEEILDSYPILKSPIEKIVKLIRRITGKAISFKTIEKELDFWLMFLCFGFSNGIDAKENLDMSSFISKYYKFNEKWFDEFTNSYDGVFDENDGYVNNPKILKLKLYDKSTLSIEFHPGDMIFFINNKEIGHTCHYNFDKISMTQFSKYSKNLSIGEKFLLLPLVRVTDELAEIENIISEFIDFSDIDVKLKDTITNIIIDNCKKE